MTNIRLVADSVLGAGSRFTYRAYRASSRSPRSIVSFEDTSLSHREANAQLGEDIIMVRVMALYHNRTLRLLLCYVSRTNALSGMGVSVLLSVLLVLEIAAQFSAIIIKLARTDCKPLVIMVYGFAPHKRLQFSSIHCLLRIRRHVRITTTRSMPCSKLSVGKPFE